MTAGIDHEPSSNWCNTFWTDAIAKEMKEVRKAFEIIPNDKVVPIGYQKIPCHMIFDVKMEDFKC